MEGGKEGGKKGRRMKDTLRPELELAQCDLGFILLAKADHTSARSVEWGNRLYLLIEEWQSSHTVKDRDTKRPLIGTINTINLTVAFYFPILSFGTI